MSLLRGSRRPPVQFDRPPFWPPLGPTQLSPNRDRAQTRGRSDSECYRPTPARTEAARDGATSQARRTSSPAEATRTTADDTSACRRSPRAAVAQREGEG